MSFFFPQKVFGKRNSSEVTFLRKCFDELAFSGSKSISVQSAWPFPREKAGAEGLQELPREGALFGDFSRGLGRAFGVAWQIRCQDLGVNDQGGGDGADAVALWGC